MFSKQQVHVLLILWVAKRPLTHEEIERMAVLAKYDDTPQGLRTRMLELERSGHVCRVESGWCEQSAPSLLAVRAD
jgi:hypothetical protein